MQTNHHTAPPSSSHPLMVSISGIRGIVGSGLTPGVIVRYASAFAGFCRRRTPGRPVVVLGRDGRRGGAPLTDLLSATLAAEGIDVRLIGVAPTPTIALAVERSGATGGISVTASHNPLEWNGMKFFASTGLFLDAEENRELQAIAAAPGSVSAAWDAQGTVTPEEVWIDRHREAVLRLPGLDLALLRKRRFHVVVDCVNASGGVIVPRLLEELGCTVVPLNCDGSGVFAHTPEPLPENLTALAARVRAARADLGIAVDPDADRLVLITEQGEPYGEEYTIVTAVRFVLGHAPPSSRTPGVVINLSTTRAVEDLAAQYGVPVYRTPVGEINVARKMLDVGALIGGEGSGGVIFPAVHAGRDAMVGIGLILQMLLEHGGPLSALRSTLPRYFMAKGKAALGDGSPDRMLNALRERYAGSARINTDDGLRIDFPDRWVHVRKSNTEPIVRIIAEAGTPEEADELLRRFHGEITR